MLEGRAIQDVWIMPRFFYGTTLRVYDPDIDAWHILWSDPLKQRYRRQIGRAHGDDIVQEGNDDTGAAVRWSFTEITTVKDGLLITGQNPASSGPAAKVLIDTLKAR